MYVCIWDWAIKTKPLCLMLVTGNKPLQKPSIVIRRKSFGCLLARSTLHCVFPVDVHNNKSINNKNINIKYIEYKYKTHK